MDEENQYLFQKQKVTLQTSIGCFFGVIFVGLIFIIVPVWLFFSHDGETELKVSHSPNDINTIKIVQKDDFPDPTIRIQYDGKHIMKTMIPDTISVQWHNDFEAEVILTKLGKEPSVVEVLFE